MRALLGFLLLFSCGAVRAQSADWSRVERLSPGTRLLVTTTYTAPCTLRSIDQDGMECLYRGRVFWVDRERIAELELPPSKRAVWIGTLTGAAFGASVVAARDDSPGRAKAVNAVFVASLTGLVSNGIGHLFQPREWIVFYVKPFSQP